MVTKDKWDSHARLVAITCVDGIDHFKLIYSFDHELEWEHFKVKAVKGQSFPSISEPYFCAFAYENEIKDQFGLDFERLNPDFGGYFLLSRDAPRTPMLRKTEERGRNDDAV